MTFYEFLTFIYLVLYMHTYAIACILRSQDNFCTSASSILPLFETYGLNSGPLA